MVEHIEIGSTVNTGFASTALDIPSARFKKSIFVSAPRQNNLKTESEELVYEFTKEPELVHQYYRIYEQEFQAVHDAHRYHHDAEDEHDREGHILVVRRGNFCVGGARISVKNSRTRRSLPLEINGFRIEDQFPLLKLHEVSYGQLGRFALLPEFRGGEITRKMHEHLFRKFVALNLSIGFATAPLLNARVYKQHCKAIGLKDTKIHFDIELPEYPMCEEIKFYLVSMPVYDWVTPYLANDKGSVPLARRRNVNTDNGYSVLQSA